MSKNKNARKTAIRADVYDTIRGLSGGDRLDLLVEIARCLDGREWNADVFQDIALTFSAHGIEFAGPDEEAS